MGRVLVRGNNRERRPGNVCCTRGNHDYWTVDSRGILLSTVYCNADLPEAIVLVIAKFFTDRRDSVNDLLMGLAVGGH